MPKWGISRGDYSYDESRNVIAKGLSSVKYMSAQLADELYRLAHSREFTTFVDVLYGLDTETSINSRQLDILIKLDFFSDFGNQRELLRINSLFVDLFKKGFAKQLPKKRIDGTPLEDLVKKYAVGVTKSGGEAKNYTLFDTHAILIGVEKLIKAAGFPDLDDVTKVNNFIEVMGYAGYCSGKQEDRPKLYVTEMWPLYAKKTGAIWGYGVNTVSIGSGKASRFTVREREYKRNPFQKGDVIYCRGYTRSGNYYYLDAYDRVVATS